MNPPRRYFYINNLSHIHKSKNYLSKNDVNKTRLSCLYTCKRFPSIPYWTNNTDHYYQHSKSHTYRVRYKTRSCCMKRKSWAITPLLFYQMLTSLQPIHLFTTHSNETSLLTNKRVTYSVVNFHFVKYLYSYKIYNLVKRTHIVEDANENMENRQ